MTGYWNEQIPFEVEATCDQRQANALLDFDHHRVVVNECWGILLTYEWMTRPELPEAPVLTVVFHPAPGRVSSPAQVRHIVQLHPPAPPFIQGIVDQLAFRGVHTP